MKNKYQLFVSTEEPSDNFESIKDIEEDLEMLNSCMGIKNSFIILKNGKFYGKGTFNNDKYKLRSQSLKNGNNRSIKIM